MTPTQVKDRNPDWKLLTGVAGAVSAAVAALAALGFQVFNPREQLERYAEQQAKVTQQIEAQLVTQSRRIDSVAAGLRYVQLLVDAQCVTTKNPMVIKALECNR